MNIKDPLKPYADDREEKRSQYKKHLAEKKMVYKCNYELVMGYIPSKTIMSLNSTRPRHLPRTNDATINGKILR